MMKSVYSAVWTWSLNKAVISLSQKPLPDNTQHTQNTNIHAPGGIQTHDRSRRAALDRAATGTCDIVHYVLQFCLQHPSIET
jgi:hypothetical protein